MTTSDVKASAGGYDICRFAAEFYDNLDHHQKLGDVDFYVNLASECGGPVLELACGTGRVLIPIARKGVEIVGFDLSEPMIEICREKLACEPEPVRERATILTGDMRTFDLGRRFPLIIVPFRAFQHLLTVEDQMACLDRIHRHLEPRGRLVVNLFNPSLDHLTNEKFLSEWGDEPEFDMPDGRRVQRRFRLSKRDLFRQVNDVEMIYYVTQPDGGRERLVHAFGMRYLFRYEAEHLLARCGLELEDVFADFERSAFGSIDPGELILVARRSCKPRGEPSPREHERSRDQ